jgi:hypothetical protein
MEPTYKPKRKDDVLAEEMDGRVVLYNAIATTVLALNPTAALIWQLCNGQDTVAEITAALIEAYPDAQDEIAAQVETTLDRFLEHGVIEA